MKMTNLDQRKGEFQTPEVFENGVGMHKTGESGQDCRREDSKETDLDAVSVVHAA